MEYSYVERLSFVVRVLKGSNPFIPAYHLNKMHCERCLTRNDCCYCLYQIKSSLGRLILKI